MVEQTAEEKLTSEIKFIIGEELDQPSVHNAEINSYMVLRVIKAIEQAGYRKEV